MAIEKYPQLKKDSFKHLDFEIRRHPKFGNVKTFLAADVDALVARLTPPAGDEATRAPKRPRLDVPPEPELLDPRWLEVEAGHRLTQSSAIERYPHLHSQQLMDLDFELARRPPKIGKTVTYNVMTYLTADVDALAAQTPAPLETAAPASAPTSDERAPDASRSPPPPPLAPQHALFSL